MTSYSELNDIALVMLQVTALLLPAVFLTMNFVKEDGLDSLRDSEIETIGNLLIIMIFSLTVTGFTASIGVLDTQLKDIILFVSVISLALFFVAYGWFVKVISPF
jgi:hypothetical protein